MYAAVAVAVHEELLFDYGPLFKVASAGPADGWERGKSRRQPGRAANSKVVPVVDSSEEKEMGTNSESYESGGSEAEDEESSDVESGGEARWKRRRRGQQHGRPAGANPNRFDEAGWDLMRAKLAAFKAKHGHCRVPRKHPADPKLSGWVSTQRKCKKKLEAGHPSPQITAERVAKLEALVFEWGNTRNWVVRKS